MAADIEAVGRVGYADALEVVVFYRGVVGCCVDVFDARCAAEARAMASINKPNVHFFIVLPNFFNINIGLINACRGMVMATCYRQASVW